MSRVPLLSGMHQLTSSEVTVHLTINRSSQMKDKAVLHLMPMNQPKRFVQYHCAKDVGVLNLYWDHESQLPSKGRLGPRLGPQGEDLPVCVCAPCPVCVPPSAAAALTAGTWNLFGTLPSMLLTLRTARRYPV